VASVGVACEVLALALALPAGTWEQGWRRRRWRWRLPADRANALAAGTQSMSSARHSVERGA